jgi:hypothetical protein
MSEAPSLDDLAAAALNAEIEARAHQRDCLDCKAIGWPCAASWRLIRAAHDAQHAVARAQRALRTAQT